MTRYYSTQRPVGIGTFPKTQQREKIVNFEQGRIFCEEIGREAWGYIEYTEPLDAQDAADYELVEAGDRT